MQSEVQWEVKNIKRIPLLILEAVSLSTSKFLLQLRLGS